MLVLGMASSHAPTMFLPVDQWSEVHRRLVKDVPQPRAFERETEEANIAYKRRIDAGFATLRGRLEAAAVDLLVIIGDDQNEVFGAPFNPTLAVFCGAEVSGTRNIRLVGQSLSENHVSFKCHPELARRLAGQLTKRGFDPAVMSELKPLSRPEAGIGHAFVRPANVLGLSDSATPIVPIFLNAYHEPLISARRCYDLGKAIGEIVADWPERVGIFGSGGLSHDPGGERAGWIDQPLDTWVLQCIAEGRSDELTGLFAFDSATLRGGTGEIRSWIVVSAAFAGLPGNVVDYIPLHHAVTGLGFAYWQAA
jgi:hypothetical protein